MSNAFWMVTEKQINVCDCLHYLLYRSEAWKVVLYLETGLSSPIQFALEI